MLEENLSSMAYLKTFSAWAKERMRKAPVFLAGIWALDGFGSKAIEVKKNGEGAMVGCEDLTVGYNTGKFSRV